MDLSKIGKCELCVLAKQVRAKKIEIGEMAMEGHTWVSELMDEYEGVAEQLESMRDSIHRFESRKHVPIRTVGDLVAGAYELNEKEKADFFTDAHRAIIVHGLHLIGISEA